MKTYLLAIVSVALTFALTWWQEHTHDEKTSLLQLDHVTQIHLKDGNHHLSMTKKDGVWRGFWNKTDQEPHFFVGSPHMNSLIESVGQLEPLRDLGVLSDELAMRYDLHTTTDHLSVTTHDKTTQTLKLGRKGYGRSQQYTLSDDHVWLIETETLNRLRRAHQDQKLTQVLQGDIVEIAIENHRFHKKGMQWFNKDEQKFELKPLFKWPVKSTQLEPPAHVQGDATPLTVVYRDGRQQNFDMFRQGEHLWLKSSFGYWVSTSKHTLLDQLLNTPNKAS